MAVAIAVSLAVLAGPIIYEEHSSESDFQRSRRIYEEGWRRGIAGDPPVAPGGYHGKDLGSWREGYRYGEEDLFLRKKKQ